MIYYLLQYHLYFNIIIKKELNMGNNTSELLISIQEKSSKNQHLDVLLTNSSCRAVQDNVEIINLRSDVASITLEIGRLVHEFGNIQSAIEIDQNQLVEKRQKIQEILSRKPDANVSTTVKKIGEIEYNMTRKQKLADDLEKRILPLVANRDRMMAILESRDPGLLLNKKRENAALLELLLNDYYRLITSQSIECSLPFITYLNAIFHLKFFRLHYCSHKIFHETYNYQIL